MDLSRTSYLADFTLLELREPDWLGRPSGTSDAIVVDSMPLFIKSHQSCQFLVYLQERWLWNPPPILDWIHIPISTWIGRLLTHRLLYKQNILSKVNLLTLYCPAGKNLSFAFEALFNLLNGAKMLTRRGQTIDPAHHGIDAWWWRAIN